MLAGGLHEYGVVLRRVARWLMLCFAGEEHLLVALMVLENPTTDFETQRPWICECWLHARSSTVTEYHRDWNTCIRLLRH